MLKHARRPRIGRILIPLVGAVLIGAPSAHAATDDLNDFNMGTSWAQYPNAWLTTTSTVQYRWLDTPPVSTEIAAINCANGVAMGSSWFPSGSSGTSYRTIGYGGAGWCFVVRGHTSSGAMFYYDGRVSR